MPTSTRDPLTQKPAAGDRRPATGESSDPEREPSTSSSRAPLRIGSNIAQRLIALATEILRLARTLPKDQAVRHVAMQLVRCATSCGANYEEARAAESKADFIHKLGVAHKELRETMYWLALIKQAELTSAQIELLQREASELSAMVGASIRTAKKNASGQDPELNVAGRRSPAAGF